MRAKPEAGMLPTELSSPMTALSDYSILLYGQEKVGKTTLAAMFPEALFLMTEPGGKSLRIFQVPILSWRELQDVLVEVSRTKRFRTLVLDTADLAYRMCEQHVCKKLGITHASDETWGKAWGLIRNEFQLTMAKMASLGRGCVFISHAHEQEVRKRSGISTHRTVPTMANIAQSTLEPMADFWVFYGTDKHGARMLHIRPDADISGGIRTGIEEEDQKFRYTDGTPIAVVPMGTSPKEAYDNFVAAFENRLPRKKGGIQPPDKSASGKRKLRVKRA